MSVLFSGCENAISLCRSRSFQLIWNWFNFEPQFILFRSRFHLVWAVCDVVFVWLQLATAEPLKKLCIKYRGTATVWLKKKNQQQSYANIPSQHWLRLFNNPLTTSVFILKLLALVENSFNVWLLTCRGVEQAQSCRSSQKNLMKIDFWNNY